MDVKKAAAETKDYIVSIRREFHRHPELSLQEFRTAQRIEEELDKFGIPHTRVGETGVLGTLKGARDNGKVLVLRADIDALPIEETHECVYRSENAGFMHACGHDAHAACLLGAAKILSENRDAFSGKVRLVFQPGEEIGKGAKPFVAAGVLDGAERVFGLHTAYDLEAGTVGLKPGINNAAVDHFRIRVHGKSTHVSTPHLGVDALYIASQIVVAVQGLVTRRTSPTEPVIIGIGKLNAGTTYNAVAAFAEMEGTTRTISQESRDRVRAQVSETAQALRRYGGTAEISGRTCAALVNDPQVCEEAARVVDELLGRRTRCLNRELSSAAIILPSLSCISRARSVSRHRQSGFAHTMITNHNGGFDVDEYLRAGTGLYVATQSRGG
ncbi:MAG: M20 metallopeptidase family protein [Butyricicoccus sp.]